MRPLQSNMQSLKTVIHHKDMSNILFPHAKAAVSPCLIVSEVEQIGRSHNYCLEIDLLDSVLT